MAVYRKPTPKPSPIELIPSSILNRKPVLAYIRAYMYVRYGIEVTVSYSTVKEFRLHRGFLFKVKTRDLHLEFAGNVNGDYLVRQVHSDIHCSDNHLGYLQTIITSCLMSPIDPVIYDTIVCFLFKE